MECTQDSLNYEHTPNFIVANVLCSVCLENGNWNQPLELNTCNICSSNLGHHRWLAWAPCVYNEAKFDYKETTEDPLTAFVEWLLLSTNRRYRTIVFSHFGGIDYFIRVFYLIFIGRYDIQLVFKNILKRKDRIVPKLIRQGLKIYTMEISEGRRCTRTTFKDSYNLIPIALERMKKTFELNDVEAKPFFPHFYNRTINYGVVRNSLPAKGLQQF
jgi:hypothetical protein